MKNKEKRVELKTGYYNPDSKGITIYIGNMSYEKDQYAVKELFEAFGKVNYVKIAVDPKTNKSKGYAFVQMPNKLEGFKAIRKLDGTSLDDRTLKVSEAKPQDNPKWQANRSK